MVRTAASADSSSAQSSHFEPLRGAPRAPFAGGLVVARALTGPARELLGGREARHVGADLGDDHLRGAPLNAGDRPQQLNGLLARGDLLLSGSPRLAPGSGASLATPSRGGIGFELGNGLVGHRDYRNAQRDDCYPEA